MRGWSVITIFCVLLALGALASGGSADQGTPTAEGTPFVCPISRPNGVRPPDQPKSLGDFGSEALWTNLTMWGEEPGIVEVPNDGHLLPDGRVIELKWAWWRFVEGELTIEGRRLDTSAPPLEAVVPEGYGASGFQVSGITFPTDGCWEVTGRVGEESLTFVVWVQYPDGFAPAGTPIAGATPAM